MSRSPLRGTLRAPARLRFISLRKAAKGILSTAC
jgi:hypothetical protein